MASPIRVTVPALDQDADTSVVRHALSVFFDTERQCSRFDPTSDLSRVNAAPAARHRVGRLCFQAVVEAAWAHRWSQGRFDPRVLSDLVALGYERWPPRTVAGLPTRAALGLWQPQLDPSTSSVVVGDRAIDLGGIGKGLAVRWASERLGARAHLIEAGGDCYCAGRAPDGAAWRIGVEDPTGHEDPVAVLEVSDRACATSSIRLRRWAIGGSLAHHLIDPRSGKPGGEGLLSVTVIARDPARAEVWSKILFLSGVHEIRAMASRYGTPACWVSDDGQLHSNELIAGAMIWKR